MRAVKTIETRSWAAPKALIGQRLYIHATKKPPGFGHLGPWTYLTTKNADGIPEAGMFSAPGSLVRLPLGMILGSIRLDTCMPMVGRDEPRIHAYTTGALKVANLLHLFEDGRVSNVEDQRPYGLFEPGRWAWLLSDPQPTTERCPVCKGKGEVLEWFPNRFGNQSPTYGACHTCNGSRACAPIPVRGRQRVWRWQP
jgi:hypothetical protein